MKAAKIGRNIKRDGSLNRARIINKTEENMK